jgi:serine protease 56
MFPSRSPFVITMTFLGALNTVGRYIVNMTRGGQEASITNNNPSENVPDAILTLTKNVLGQNVTKTIEPMIKRIGVVETRDDPAVAPISDKLLLNTTSATFEMVDAKKKKPKNKKTKRKEQPAEQPAEQQQQQVELFSAESRKISIF